jgi:hypothetical protein
MVDYVNWRSSKNNLPSYAQGRDLLGSSVGTGVNNNELIYDSRDVRESNRNTALDVLTDAVYVAGQVEMANLHATEGLKGSYFYVFVHQSKHGDYPEVTNSWTQFLDHWQLIHIIFPILISKVELYKSISQVIN